MSKEKEHHGDSLVNQSGFASLHSRKVQGTNLWSQIAILDTRIKALDVTPSSVAVSSRMAFASFKQAWPEHENKS